MPIPTPFANVIVDPKAYEDGDAVDDAFRFIREQTPFAVAEPEGYEPFWVASRHADVMAIERQADLFHSGDRSTTVQPREHIARSMARNNGNPNPVRSLVSVDGEEHRALRAILFPHVTPKALKDLQDGVRLIARQFVWDMLARAPECDFAQDVAFLYPLRVIMGLLGIPPEDEPFMLKLTQELFSSSDPELNRSGSEVTLDQRMANFAQIQREFEAYFDDLTSRCRKAPEPGLTSLIANARLDGDYLTRAQLMGYYMIAATAGHDTTSNTTAGAMWELAARPGVFAGLKADPTLVGAFVEESIRWVTPVKHFMRSAVEDTEVAVQSVRRGDWIMLAYQSANRDDRVFQDPFDFRLDRTPNRHLAFGYGGHVCLGQHLARLEMRLFWEELLPHLSALELAGQPARTRSNFVCGPKHVPIRFSVK